MGFLVGGEALLMCDLDEAAPRPGAPADQAEVTAVLGIEPQHAVQQHAAADPLADLAEAAPALGRGAEIEFAGILDGQHMPAPHRRRGLIAPAFDQLVNRHLAVGEKPPKADHLRAPPLRPALSLILRSPP
jgi:hypothetical protein